jgi:pimeloyl-ACP methyl ester carboxylesterase
LVNLVCVAASCGLAAPARGDDVRLKDLTEPVRSRVDAAARAQRLEKVPQEAVNLAGNATSWLISQVSLSAEEEDARATLLHKRILERHRSIALPEAAGRVWQKLLDQLPPSLKPEAFHYSLKILDVPDLGVTTPGGGRVYLTRSLMEDLLANMGQTRGEAALAFLLAQQLGHMARLHCRRGWQLQEIQEEIKTGIKLGVEMSVVKQLLQTGVDHSDVLIYFLYTREQHYEADCFAFSLCRNAGIDLDAALDALRYLVVQAHPRLLRDADFRPADRPRAETLRYYLSEQPEPLVRLKRLLMERAGEVIEETDYGLFLYLPGADGRTGKLTRCGDQSIRANEAPIVLLHGLRGDNGCFRTYLPALGEQPETRGRPVLVFRYPNNESLSRSGLFLERELRRVVAAPEKAAFICHSAGGLVFRFYAEKRGGAFAQAVFLATPHLGSRLTQLKFLVDLAGFGAAWHDAGLREAIAEAIPEGRGEISFDVQPDSLFLRYLGHDAKLAARYHVFYGQVLKRRDATLVSLAFTAAKQTLRDKLVERVDAPFLKRQVTRLMDQLTIPDEVLAGDLIVTVRSADLKGAGKATATRLNHLTIKTDEEVLRQVVKSIAGQ